MSSRPVRTARTLCARQRRSKKRTLYATQAGRCGSCGSACALEESILKHKVHRKAGGTNRLENLYVICHGCNATRRDLKEGSNDGV